jgi:hypothetical protein
MGKKIFLTCCVLGFVLLSIISIISTIIYEFTGELFFLMIFTIGGIVATGISLVIYCVIGVIKLIWEDC